MKGRATCIVLGAGASMGYEDGNCGIPGQRDLVGKLFMGMNISVPTEGAPSFVGPSGLRHSFRLGQAFRAKFALPETGAEMGKLDFWTELQKHGHTLESLYAELESEWHESHPWLLRDFEALVRTAVLDPTAERTPEQACRHHRHLVEALEPTDFLVSFNWDPLLPDALLRYSHFWFPVSGIADLRAVPVMRPGQKAHAVRSLVTWFPIHGSVSVYRTTDANDQGIAYVAPQTMNSMSAMLAVKGIGPNDPEFEKKFSERSLTDEENERIEWGQLYVGGKWLEPTFVPPSKFKPQYVDWFVKHMLANLHTRLPHIEHLVIAGYSFPEADRDHFERLFVDGVMPPDLPVTVVNRSNSDGAWQALVRTFLPSTAKVEFPDLDFGAFVKTLAA